MVRPLLWMAVAFLAGAAAGGQVLEGFPVGLLWACAAAALLTAVLAHLEALRRLRSPVVLLVCFALLGALTGRQATETLSVPPSLTPYFSRTGTLYISEITAPANLRGDKVRLTLRLHRAFTESALMPVDGAVLVTVPLESTPSSPLPWNHGDWVLAALSLKHFQNFKNPGGFDYIRSMAGKGIYARASVSNPQSLVRIHPPPWLEKEAATSFSFLQRQIDRFRLSAFYWLKQRLSPDAADFYGSLLLGYRIPPAWSERLSRSGVIHLLSISGLHLGMVSLGVFWLVCRTLRLLLPSLLMKRSDRHYALWPALLAASAYALISGLALPTWRSLIMILLLMGSAFIYRYPDPFTALGVAALLIVLISPESLREVSFQLSFLSMLGLFVVYPPLRERFLRALGPHAHDPPVAVRVFSPFAEAFLASIAASMMVMPIVIHHFHGISLAGFLANTILVPLTGFTVLPLGLTALCLFAVSEILALPFLLLGSLFLELCLWMIPWFSDLSWAFVWIGDLSVAHVVAIYSIFGILAVPWTFRQKAAATAGIAFLLLIGTVWERIDTAGASRGMLRVTVIDVGQGTSTLVRFPEGKTMLVDGGGFPDDSFDVGRMVLAPFLWHEGIRALDAVVLSHDHPDHRNGLRAILAHFDVGSLWETGLDPDEINTDELAKIAARRRITIRRLPELREEQLIDGCRVRVLNPSPVAAGRHTPHGTLNNTSVVLEITYGGTSVLLPGDIDQTVERQILPALRPSEHVLLVAAHHGSDSSNGEAFLEALNPRAVLVSCGTDNAFGFPSQRLLSWCANRGVPCFRTDRQGAIEGVSDGARWRVHLLKPQ